MQYTTILHRVRKSFGLSANEYCVADLIFYNGNDPRSTVPGWSTAGRGEMGQILDLSRQTIITIVAKLSGLGLVERDPNDNLRTTALWFDSVKGCKETLHPVKKVDTPAEGCKDSLQGVKILGSECKESLQEGVKKLDTTPIYKKSVNTESNNKSADALSLGSDLDPKEEQPLPTKKRGELNTPPRVAASPPEVSENQFVYQTKKNEWVVVDWPEGFTGAMRKFYLEQWLPHHEKKSRSRLTKQGVQLQLEDLQQLPEPQFIACLKKAISSNWQGFFTESYLNPNGNHNPKNSEFIPNGTGRNDSYGAGAILPPGASYKQQSLPRTGTHRPGGREGVNGATGTGPVGRI